MEEIPSQNYVSVQGVASSHPARKRNQAEGPHSYKQCRMKRGCLDTKDIDDLNKICSRLPKKQLWLPPKLIFFGQGNKQGRLRHSSVCIIHFFNGRDSLSELCKCSRLLQLVASSHPARKRNQAEGPHSYKQCLMQLRWLDDS